MTDEIKPIDVDGMPCHSDECPKYDGKRCDAIGFQPDRLCEPAVRMLVEANLKLDKASRELAFLLRWSMEREEEWKALLDGMKGQVEKVEAMKARLLVLQAEAMKAERWERATRKIAVHGTTKDILSAMRNGDLDEIEKLL